MISIYRQMKIFHLLARSHCLLGIIGPYCKQKNDELFADSRKVIHHWCQLKAQKEKYSRHTILLKYAHMIPRQFRTSVMMKTTS